MSLRTDRYAAARAWHRRLAEDFEAFAPGFLDALEAIDAKHGQAGAATLSYYEPSDDRLTAWVESHPAEFKGWVRRQNRVNGAPPPFDAPASKPPMSALPPAAGTARRRTAKLWPR